MLLNPSTYFNGHAVCKSFAWQAPQAKIYTVLPTMPVESLKLRTRCRVLLLGSSANSSSARPQLSEPMPIRLPALSGKYRSCRGGRIGLDPRKITTRSLARGPAMGMRAQHWALLLWEAHIFPGQAHPCSKRRKPDGFELAEWIKRPSTRPAGRYAVPQFQKSGKKISSLPGHVEP